MTKTLSAAIIRVVAVALATILLVWLWIKAPQVIVVGFDLNLVAIKKVAAVTPAPYGAMGEAALRGLGADRALIFAEGAFLVRLLIGLIVRRATWR